MDKRCKLAKSCTIFILQVFKVHSVNFDALYLSGSYVQRYVRECNFIHDRNGNTTVPVAIFKETQQLLDTECYVNPIIYV